MMKCPKCGASNKPDSSACYNCFTSLDGVPVTRASGAQSLPSASGALSRPRPQAQSASDGAESGQRPAPLAGQQVSVPPAAAPPTAPEDVVIYGAGPLVAAEDHAEPVSVVGQPLASESPQPPGQAPLEGAYGPQPGPYGPPPATRRYPRPREADRPERPRYSTLSSMLTGALTLLVLLGISGFLTWRYVLLPKQPTAAVRQFITALVAGDEQKLVDSLSQSSQPMVRMVRAVPGGIGNLNLFQSQNQGFEEGKQYVLRFVSIEKTTAKVKVKPGPMPIEEFKEENLPPEMKDGLTFVVLKEGKDWKVDLMHSFAAIGGTMTSELMSQLGVNTPGPPPMPPSR